MLGLLDGTSTSTAVAGPGSAAVIDHPGRRVSTCTDLHAYKPAGCWGWRHEFPTGRDRKLVHRRRRGSAAEPLTTAACRQISAGGGVHADNVLTALAGRWSASGRPARSSTWMTPALEHGGVKSRVLH